MYLHLHTALQKAAYVVTTVVSGVGAGDADREGKEPYILLSILLYYLSSCVHGFLKYMLKPCKKIA